jgi:AhpD family alkylhydroperoxidase
MTDYPQIAKSYQSGMADLAAEVPDTVDWFTALVQTCTADGELSVKVKELIAFSIAITARCDGCSAHHAKAVRDARASRKEVAEMIGVAVLMGGGPSSVYGVEALRAFDAFGEQQG